MKKSITIFASIILMTLSANVMAQNTSNASADASATIILPISIEKDQDLSFGTIASTNEAGWVKIDAAGNVTSEHDNQLTGLSTPTTANFTINGETGSVYSIALPTSVNLTGTGTPMIMNAFTTSISGELNGLTLAGGEQEFSVGATLNVNAEQAAGVYSGSFDVTVSYN